MTTLDQRLYAWLVQADERRFQSGFNAYFSVAFPAVLRHLARLSRWDSAQLEDLAQDALIKFFDRVGRRRRTASEAVAAALRRIRPLSLGPFHQRQVRAWTYDVASFRDAAMGFLLLEGSEASSWKADVRALTDRIPLLQRQGGHLLHAVHLELRWKFDAEHPLRAANEMQEKPAVVDAAEKAADGDAELSCRPPRDDAEHLVKEVIARTAHALIAEEQHPGMLEFVGGTFTVVGTLPQLRVPTNGYLFEIAMTLYLDECKKRGRKKRGGTGFVVADEACATTAAESLTSHPIDQLTLESEVDTDDVAERVAARPASDHSSVGFAAGATDPTNQYENEEFLEKFYIYLRKPLDMATAAYERAEGRSGAERHRVESIARKFDRTIAVLSMMGEGHTQEQIAEGLGLTRNQVKYIIELVQESYAQFAAASNTGEHSHGR
jgi:DNA-directed RNA polymerase specialized sigma24 family protein/DNA-binding CsgD family transcriptional regulator